MFDTCLKINMYIYKTINFIFDCYSKSYKDVIVYIHSK